MNYYYSSLMAVDHVAFHS